MAYNDGGYTSGPTLSGCSASSSSDPSGRHSKGGAALTLTFALSNADTIKLQPYYDGKAVIGGRAYDRPGSKMEVLLNASLFCMQQDGGGNCRDDGTGRGFNASSKDELSKAWVTVDVGPGRAPNEVAVDLSRANGSEVFAVRYADNGDCCSEDPPTAAPCPPASCPIMGAASALPANPFIAKIVGGKCACIAPQICDE